MKYLIVSDYDGTLKIKNQDDVTIKNIEKLQLLNLKSKLLISTGRLYNSIKNEIEQFNIPLIIFLVRTEIFYLIKTLMLCIKQILIQRLMNY